MKSLQQSWNAVRDYLADTTLFGTTLENIVLKSLYLVLLTGSIVLMMPSERPFEYSNLKVGSIATEEIIAPFKFAILKTDSELERERQAARQSVPAVFTRRTETESRQRLKLNSFVEELKGFFDANPLEVMLDPNQSDPVRETNRAPIDSFLVQFNLKYNLKVDVERLRQFYNLYQDGGLTALGGFLTQTMSIVYETGIIDRPKDEVSGTTISLKNEGIEEDTDLDGLLDMSEARERFESLLRSRYPDGSPAARVGTYLLGAFLQPNLIYDAEVTQERREQAVHDVPLTRGYVEQDERIIDSNEKITEEVYQKLYSLSVVQKERSATLRGLQQIKFLFGKYLYAVILLFLTLLYIYFYRRYIFEDNQLLGMFTLILLIQFGCLALVTNFTEWPQLTVPIVLAPMLLAMLLDFGVAVITTVMISLVFGSVQGNDFTFTVTVLIVGSVAVFSVQKIRNRRQMFRAILFLLLAYLAVGTTFGLLHFKTVKTIVQDFAYLALPNAILSPIVVFFLLGAFERLFGVTTDITLLELSDLNHPLLKRLSVQAPGSFHHSIVVANLAEAAAMSVNANALLTRVGCYFHDIGKVFKPEYFVENQMGGVNKHDNITPSMSTLILINHVKEGAKLANKHNLPRAVINFITEHHGTSLIAFFYHKALENKGDKEINETDFHYPGPRPQTKETGIAMLADTVEAASRALNNPTPQRIRNLVDQLVDRKLEERQLDDCDLTLKDISQIKEAFIPILTGIHHVRIEYPGGDSDKEKSGKGGKESKETRDRNGQPERGEDGKGPATATRTPSKKGSDIALPATEGGEGPPGAGDRPQPGDRGTPGKGGKK